MSNEAVMKAFIEKFGPEPRGETGKKIWNYNLVGWQAALEVMHDNLMCPVHTNLDRDDKLKPFDNCIACIRNERDELKATLASQQQLMPCGHPQAFFQDCDYFEDSPGGRRTHVLATCLLCKAKEDMQKPQGDTCKREPKHPMWALQMVTRTDGNISWDQRVCILCHHAQALAVKEEEIARIRKKWNAD